jgi:hypothetical protein
MRIGIVSIDFLGSEGFVRMEKFYTKHGAKLVALE